MAQLPHTFNPDDVPPDEFEKLPIGRHLVQVTESEVKDNKSNTGTLAVFVLTVMDGPSEGRTWYEFANIIHQNEKAQEMGQRTLGNICRVTGKSLVDDTEELHFIPFYIDVGDRVDRRTGEVNRVIKEYSAYSVPAGRAAPQQRQAAPAQQRPAPQQQRQAAPAQQRQAAPVQQRQAASGGQDRPWGKRAAAQPAQQPDDEIPY